MAFETGQLVLMAGLLALVGVAGGLLAGLLGVGGGIVIVPALFWVLSALGVAPDVAMSVAVGTSLATIIPTSISSARAHHAKGNVDTALLRRWAPFVFAGAMTGGLLSYVLDGTALTLLFGTVALLVAANMAFPRGGGPTRTLPTRRGAQASIASVIGLFSALMGIGGGTFGVPVLSLFGYVAHRAVGTAAAIGLVIAVPGTFGFVLGGLGEAGRPPLSLGYVNLPAVAVIVPLTVTMAPVGAGLGHRLSAVRLKQVFALFLAITALRMLWASFA
ncbi:sulfite exporter TauE/SafE family protein [Jannaschia sp. LMIT008]|uniref:sulfite exporter TauE/SafE family protein n=1 Tax=Jannaschia maritima TaxID=3032585 RepID=UPI002810ED24|nr:sulfite exporter TauE/SafE family protein [Jannaschia sp. LMIT008]